MSSSGFDFRKIKPFISEILCELLDDIRYEYSSFTRIKAIIEELVFLPHQFNFKFLLPDFLTWFWELRLEDSIIIKVNTHLTAIGL